MEKKVQHYNTENCNKNRQIVVDVRKENIVYEPQSITV